MGLGTYALASLQDRLLYFPAKAEIADFSSPGLQPWPSAGNLRGLVADAAGATRGTVIVFHGNAGHAGHRTYYADTLKAIGFRVVLAEYPGYGPRDGRLGEASLVDDAEETIKLAYEMYGAPLVVVGESLGSGVAAAAAGRQRDKIAGLLMITPWRRLEEVAAYHFPWLPVRWLLRDRYDSESNLRDFGHPVAVLVAERDMTVPPVFGRALYESISEPKRLTDVPAADHNDWRGRLDEAWWTRTMDFLLAR
jgi:pimeloyl-ACP methyl ester carboxylesterase